MVIPSHKIDAWVKEHFPDCKERKNGSELIICNPFDGDTNYKMNINVDAGLVHDWRSDAWAGPINPVTGKRNCTFIKFVQLYLKCNYFEAIKAVTGSVSYSTNRIAKKPIVESEITLPEFTIPLANDNSTMATILKRWLCKRGYSEADIDHNNIHYFTMDVYWPYYEFGELVYWQSRSRLNKSFNFPAKDIKNESGEIIGISQQGKSDFLYGFDDVKRASYVIITESIFGKQSLGEQAVASGGAILTEQQATKINIFGPKSGIILAPDNDSAGISSITSNYRVLKTYGYPIFYALPPKIEFIDDDGQRSITKDYNELIEYLNMSKTEVRKIFDSSIRKIDTAELSKLYKLSESNLLYGT